MVLLPWRPVYPEAFYGDVRVLEVHTVCEEGLDIVKVLRFEFGDRGKAVVILLDQLGHKVLIEGQLVVAGDHHLEVVRKATWEETEQRRRVVREGAMMRGAMWSRDATMNRCHY